MTNMIDDIAHGERKSNPPQTGQGISVAKQPPDAGSAGSSSYPDGLRLCPVSGIWLLGGHPPFAVKPQGGFPNLNSLLG